MKRAIPFLMLAVPACLVMWACETSEQARDIAGPLLKADKCEPWPECRDGGGGEDEYTAIDLRSLTGRGKASQSTNGSAHDITEPDADGVLRVV
jgi:hypothetical protein